MSGSQLQQFSCGPPLGLFRGDLSAGSGSPPTLHKSVHYPCPWRETMEISANCWVNWICVSARHRIHHKKPNRCNGCPNACFPCPRDIGRAPVQPVSWAARPRTAFQDFLLPLFSSACHASPPGQAPLVTHRLCQGRPRFNYPKATLGPGPVSAVFRIFRAGKLAAPQWAPRCLRHSVGAARGPLDSAGFT